jgi:pyridoxamine 5'-phosphate oxidase
MRSNQHDLALREEEVDPDPIAQFKAWLAAAEQAGVRLPEAMTLATATKDGAPSARTLLLKGVDATGFVFYTSHESRKANELAENPRAALVFYWEPLGRQVRAEGWVTRFSRSESAEYFRTRPRGSKLGAWASRQSEVIPDRNSLESRVAELARKYGARDVPLPPSWGGYRLRPHAIEFWQHRPDRLHDRLRYVALEDGRWTVERLSP